MCRRRWRRRWRGREGIGENRHPGLRNLANYAWGCRHFYLESEPSVPESLDDDGAVNRAGVVNYLAHYADKVVHCRHPNDVAEFFEQIMANP